MQTITYLELTDRSNFRPAACPKLPVQLIEAAEPLPAFYRFLYTTVGQAYNWVDRLNWSDERLAEHLARPAVTLLVLYLRGTPAGYIELDSASQEPGTEVAYFGLFQPFHGRGLGKYLLSAGVAQSFAAGAERIWLHTCNQDGPHALANYQARGFVVYKTITPMSVAGTAVLQ